MTAHAQIALASFVVASLVLIVILASSVVSLRRAFARERLAAEQLRHEVRVAAEAARQATFSLDADRDELRTLQHRLAVADRDRQLAAASATRSLAEVEAFRQRESELVQMRDGIETARAELVALGSASHAALADARSQLDRATVDLQEVRNAILTADALLEQREIVVYPRHYPEESSEELKARMDEVRARQAEIRRKGQVVIRFGPAVQEKLAPEERAKLKSLVRLARLTLEGAADHLLDNVKATNQERLEVQFQVLVTDLKRLLSPWGLEIGKNYQATVHEALDLRAEFLQQVEKERDEQRAIREQMREEAAAQREAEKAQKEAETEERRTERELQKAQEAASQATTEERGRWMERVQELEARLAEAHALRQRAVAQAQLTKTGHVYIISNIGSFGDGVFKVGMTRRLDPEDRIIELGDASVPFPFDVHGMIRSTDAPALEAAIHRHLEARRVNLVNDRKEFFRVSMEELIAMVVGLGLKVELTALAEAVQWRQSVAMRQAEPPHAMAAPIDEVGAEPEDDDGPT